MSETTTAVENTTTEVVPTEVQAAPVEQTNQVEQVQETQAEPEVQAVEEPDYSYVPKKFMKDGKPDWEGLTKSYQHMEKKASSKGLIVPEDISEYEWTSNAPIAYSEEAINAFKADAQKAGMTKEQYAFAMGKYEEVMTQAGLNADASAHALQKVWGDEYEDNLNLARKGFEEFAPSDVNKNDPIFNHPTVLRLLAKIGAEMGEDTQSSGKASRPSAMTKEDIEAIQKSPDYWSNKNSQEKVRQWYESKYK